jgi:NADPH2:quinone reductase
VTDDMMRAVQVVNHEGPASAFALAKLPIPPATHELAPEDAVLVDVEAAGVSFPELLQSYGRYQLQPDLPFVPGSEVAGRIRSAPGGSAFKPGDRVAAYTNLGAFAEVAAAPSWLTMPLAERLSFGQGAALLLNYNTAYFAMAIRGRLKRGDKMLVHGAAGGIGTAALQIAVGLGIRTIAVVSSEEKAEIARAAGAGEVVLADDDWKAAAKATGGVDAVLDTVGGDRVLDSLRSLCEGGRLIVVGFTSGVIPEVRLNRVLLRNLDVVGVEWGYVFSRPEVNRQIVDGVSRLVDQGFVTPIVNHRFPLEQAGEAVALFEERRATGKVVLELHERGNGRG